MIHLESKLTKVKILKNWIKVVFSVKPPGLACRVIILCQNTLKGLPSKISCVSKPAILSHFSLSKTILKDRIFLVKTYIQKERKSADGNFYYQSEIE